MRPLIGVTTYREPARWGSWDVPAVLLPANYVDAVWAAGGQPVLLPTGAVDAGVVAPLDGLVLAGGADVDPQRYGQPAGPQTLTIRPDRDRSESEVLAAGLARDLPVLAICRGMQLLNVELGGDLIQDLPAQDGRLTHDPGPGRFEEHQVTVEPGSRVAALVGTTVAAHCHHHQALDRVAPGLVVTAHAEDGTVEAVEGRGPSFRIGVQWHPEAGRDGRLFDALVLAAAQRNQRPDDVRGTPPG